MKRSIIHTSFIRIFHFFQWFLWHLLFSSFFLPPVLLHIFTPDCYTSIGLFGNSRHQKAAVRWRERNCVEAKLMALFTIFVSPESSKKGSGRGVKISLLFHRLPQYVIYLDAKIIRMGHHFSWFFFANSLIHITYYAKSKVEKGPSIKYVRQNMGFFYLVFMSLKCVPIYDPLRYVHMQGLSFLATLLRFFIKYDVIL